MTLALNRLTELHDPIAEAFDERRIHPDWADLITTLASEHTRQELLDELRAAYALWLDYARNPLVLEKRSSVQKDERRRRAVRALGDLTGADLAREHDVTPGTISRWISGERAMPREVQGWLTDRDHTQESLTILILETLWLALCSDKHTAHEWISDRILQLWTEATNLIDSGADDSKILKLAGEPYAEARPRLVTL